MTAAQAAIAENARFERQREGASKPSSFDVLIFSVVISCACSRIPLVSSIVAWIIRRVSFWRLPPFSYKKPKYTPMPEGYMLDITRKFIEARTR